VRVLPSTAQPRARAVERWSSSSRASSRTRCGSSALRSRTPLGRAIRELANVTETEIKAQREGAAKQAMAA